MSTVSYLRPAENKNINLNQPDALKNFQRRQKPLRMQSAGTLQGGLVKSFATQKRLMPFCKDSTPSTAKMNSNQQSMVNSRATNISQEDLNTHVLNVTD